MKVLVTGAGGFIGQVLCGQLLSDGLGGQRIDQLIGLDLQPPQMNDARWLPLAGSLTEPEWMAQALQAMPDVVFHLASLPGGAAEAQPALGRAVNLQASMALIEALERPVAPPRLILASTVAVYGADLPACVDEQTPTAPGLSYGAHKRIAEILLADAVRRGRLQGASLRLPGVVARPGDGAGLMSAFMSQLFWRLRDGQALTLPVRPEGMAWWISAAQCARNLRQAAASDLGALGPRCLALMPALHLSVQAVMAALARRYGQDRLALVHSEPDPKVERLFAQYPPLRTELAERIGLRHDGDADGLVAAVLGG